MNINEFEKTLLTNKITPVELSSDDLHRTKIINKWTKTDEDRAWMFFETICRIAVAEDEGIVPKLPEEWWISISQQFGYFDEER